MSVCRSLAGFWRSMMKAGVWVCEVSCPTLLLFVSFCFTCVSLSLPSFVFRDFHPVFSPLWVPVCCVSTCAFVPPSSFCFLDHIFGFLPPVPLGFVCFYHCVFSVFINNTKLNLLCCWCRGPIPYVVIDTQFSTIRTGTIHQPQLPLNTANVRL